MLLVVFLKIAQSLMFLGRCAPTPQGVSHTAFAINFLNKLKYLLQSRTV